MFSEGFSFCFQFGLMGPPSVGIAKIQVAIRVGQTQVSWRVPLAFGAVVWGVAFIWDGVLGRSPVWLGKGAVVVQGGSNTGFVETSIGIWGGRLGAFLGA